eukprot:CAMPEP_0204519968 /NCGR_PEP_ID=MMETSP0661-20131031/5013_1 /ASSEMBLY_ACC=CAM_ASM_000606 /TAXON_ID=109239 /ORGANISM="Alexandrium margalefi, Strain AMGDE01CS-322" /LENGTH=144 /DNA_ID=CAMNT_0051525499 /DNA_START=206 /DNA_END=640 /DNA_ORIENTATION=-
MKIECLWKKRGATARSASAYHESTHASAGDVCAGRSLRGIHASGGPPPASARPKPAGRRRQRPPASDPRRHPGAHVAARTTMSTRCWRRWRGLGGPLLVLRGRRGDLLQLDPALEAKQAAVAHGALRRLRPRLQGLLNLDAPPV